MREITSGPSELTAKEKECLVWAARGKSSAEIAVIIALTPRGVNFRFTSAIKKLGAVNRTQAVALALERGLISLKS